MDVRKETWDRHHRAVRSFAVHLCGNPAQADDLASEAFVRLWTTGSDISGQSVRAYLLTIVRNLFYRSRRRAHESIAEPDEVVDASIGADDELAKREESAELHRALAALGDPDREALLLRYDGELSYREIAAALGITAGAARVRVHRAHRRMLEHMTGVRGEKR